jgi:hypothetical protein
MILWGTPSISDKHVIPMADSAGVLRPQAVVQIRMPLLDLAGEISGFLPKLATNRLSQGSGMILDAP